MLSIDVSNDGGGVGVFSCGGIGNAVGAGGVMRVLCSGALDGRATFEPGRFRVTRVVGVIG